MKLLAQITSYICFLLAVPSLAFETTARSAYVIDVSTGMVMYDKNSDVPLPPASMSKLMTIEMIFHALKTGQITKETEFSVSEKAWAMGGSKMFVELGSRVSILDLLQGIVVQSGNDACVVVAEGLGGSEENFARLMNARAAELGLTDSSFGNASGWPHPQQLMSAQDLAKLAHHLATSYPEYFHFFAQEEFTYNKIKQANRNPLLGVVNGATGFKTGHTEEAGYGLVGGVSRGGRNVVFVLMGLNSQAERAQEAERLAAWALEGFSAKTQYKAGETIAYASTWHGAKPEIALTTKFDFVTLQPIGSTHAPKVTLQFSEPMAAPIEKGIEIGKLQVEPVGTPAYELPLYTAEAVARGGFVSRFNDSVQQLVMSQLSKFAGSQ